MGFFDRFRKSVSETAIIEAPVSDETGFYCKAVAFTTAVSYIANIISKLEIKHMVRNDEGKIVEVRDKAYYYLNISPNPNQSASKMKQDLIFNLFVDNDALVFVTSSGMYVANSYSHIKNGLTPDRFENITVDGQANAAGLNRSIQDVAFFQLDNQEIANLINCMLEEYSKIFQAVNTSFEHANDEKWKWKLPSAQAGDAKFEKESNQKRTETLKSFLNSKRAVWTEYTGQSLEKINIGDKQLDVSQYQNVVKSCFETVAQAFKMPVSLLYGNMTNVKDILNGWASVSIDPLCKMLSETLTKAIVSYEDFLQGEKFIVDTSMLFHMDWFDMLEKGDKGIASGIACVDEIRQKMGEEPLETEASTQYYITKNYSKIQDATNS
ncbi:MAG: phage portal protein [Clostridium sp.]|nr:phage portal protein [Clostridium sp.]